MRPGRSATTTFAGRRQSDLKTPQRADGIWETASPGLPANQLGPPLGAFPRCSRARREQAARSAYRAPRTRGVVPTTVPQRSSSSTVRSFAPDPETPPPSPTGPNSAPPPLNPNSDFGRHSPPIRRSNSELPLAIRDHIPWSTRSCHLPYVAICDRQLRVEGCHTLPYTEANSELPGAICDHMQKSTPSRRVP